VNRAMESAPVRVCLDARMADGSAGGVQQTVIGLAHGLARLGGEDQYLFLVRPGSHAWLDPYMVEPCRLLPLAGAEARDWRQWLRLRVPAQGLDRLARSSARALFPVRVPRSDGTAEAADVDVVHFTRQGGFLTDLPSIYCPQDLQHVHLPGFFGAYERKWRNAVYPALAGRARATIALTRAGRRDLVEHLRVPPERVFVVGYAPVLDAYPVPDEAALRRLRSDHGLPEAFAFFPAQSYPHKNHVRLLEALAILRGEGLVVPLVCVGGRDSHHSAIVRRARALRLGDQVRNLGFLPPSELRGLYDLARILVFPSLFEGFGMPVLEAFRAGLPVACSDIPPLAEVAGDAAVRFDPASSRGMADAIRRLWSDAALREDLSALGRSRAAGATWEGVARRFRALYRLAAGRTLDAEDQGLVASMR